MSRKIIALTLVLIIILVQPIYSASSQRTMKVTMNGALLNGKQATMFDGSHYYVPAEMLAKWGLDVQADATARSLRLKPDPARSVAVNYAPVYYRDSVIVLMYHNLTEKPGNANELPVSQFRAHMEALDKRGFRVIDMKQYADFVSGKGKVPANAVLITFDDGYESFYKLAYPVLRKYDFPATNFIIIKTLDEPSGVGVPKLTWDQVREMHANGISFYNHTFNSHRYGAVDAKGNTRPMLTSRLYVKDAKRVETEAEYKARVLNDLQSAERRLKEELGNELGVLAFPYGAYNDTVLALARQAGIDVTFTIKPGMNAGGQKNGFRVNAGGLDNQGDPMIVGMQRALQKAPASRVAVRFNGQPVAFQNSQPFISGGRIWVPLREAARMFGYSVTLDNANNALHLTR